jgi:hypothetical protein
MWCGNCFVDCINAGAQSIPLEELMQQSWDFRSEIEQAAAIEGGKYVAALSASAQRLVAPPSRSRSS